MRSLILILIFCPILEASVSYTYVQKKAGFYTKKGVVSGGNVKSEASLLGIRSKLSKNKSQEKWIFDLGGVDFSPLKKESPYFTASIDKQKHRVVLEILKTKLQQLDLDKLKKSVKKSGLVKSVEQDFDLESGSLIFNFLIKKEVKMRAYPLLNAKKPTRIIVDFSKE